MTEKQIPKTAFSREFWKSTKVPEGTHMRQMHAPRRAPPSGGGWGGARTGLEVGIVERMAQTISTSVFVNSLLFA